MSITINRFGNGGVSESNAILMAHVPTRSTVTASKGGVILTPKMWASGLTADKDVAMFIFSPAQFDSVNPWTITATNKTGTASATVLITTNNEYEVALSYDYKLYWDGYVTAYPASAWKSYTYQNGSHGEINFRNNYIEFAGDVYDYGEQSCGLQSAIDLSEYTQLGCTAKGIQTYGADRTPRMVIATSAIADADWFKSPTVTAVFQIDNTVQEYTIDVSAYSGSYYLGFGGCGKCEIYRFWLKK